MLYRHGTSLIKERENRRSDVIREITSKWGSTQTITGPFISVPYNKLYKTENGKTEKVISYYHILPDQLKYESNVKSKNRYRGLYEAVLYDGTIKISAKFNNIQISNSEIIPNLIKNRIHISLGITDLKGITDQVKIDINKESKYMEWVVLNI
jgi:inner membrane protein